MINNTTFKIKNEMLGEGRKSCEFTVHVEKQSRKTKQEMERHQVHRKRQTYKSWLEKDYTQYR